MLNDRSPPYPVSSSTICPILVSAEKYSQVEKQPSSRGFGFLNTTQFLNAFNDNLLKQMLMWGTAAGGIWASQIAPGGQAYASLCLAVPFILLSGFAGQFSDRYSKRTVIIVVKFMEVLIGIMALVGFLMGSLWVLIAALVLISIQSTFFSPAKYGILPEIIEEKLLSRANGTLSMFTYVACILGIGAAGPLYDLYISKTFWWDWNWQWPEMVPPGIPGILWIPGAAIVLVGILGMIATRGLPRVPVQNPEMKIRPIFFRAYRETWRDIRGTPLGTVVLAWSYFYMIVAGLAILIPADFADLLDITRSKATPLLLCLAVSLGIGDYTAGRLSGHRIRPGMIPVGAIGTTVMLFALGAIPLNYYLIAGCLSLAGFMAGFIMVPLQTMTQQLASEDQRGGVLGLWNCGSFVGIVIGNVIFLVVKSKHINMASNHVFYICGVLGVLLIVLLYTGWQKQFEEAVAEPGQSDREEQGSGAGSTKRR